MNLSFKRITSSGNFIPEIDGLRFIAIASVVLFHLSGFIIAKDQHHYTSHVDYSFFQKLLEHGDIGVPLFFVISGFILGKPFAEYYIGKKNPVDIKKYFLRRLTRLEPPYILVITILFFASVFVVKKLSVDEGVKSYFSSLFYLHNFLYGRNTLPLLDSPAWSLEIEIQFYIIAPIMARLFLIRSFLNRRLTFVAIILLFTALKFLPELPFVSLLDFMQFFLAGFLLADLYVSKSFILPKTKFDSVVSIVMLSFLWIFSIKDCHSNLQVFIVQTFQLVCIFLVYYYVLFHKIFKLLTFRLITNIGGMCYSIYLLHFPVISMIGNVIVKYSFSKSQFVNTLLYSLFILLPLMLISSAFFLLIERPCMDKNWVKKLFNRKAVVNQAS